MSINGREPACSVSYKITIIELSIRQKLQTPFILFTRSDKYITMNYCEEDGLHAIKLMAEIYLREMRMSLLLVWK